MTTVSSHVSTHILDLALGEPARDTAVRLERQNDDRTWLPLGSARTDQDGRCPQLLPSDVALAPGNYRLTVDTASYFAATQRTGLYPVVEIVFQVRAGDAHFHLPLLLSPNGYTTYRGI
jgi:5-hydroxyisourate hydrolase